MRIAILTDIHGNLAALEAVLADVADQPHDALWLGGDYALFGPRPAECVDRLRALEVPAILGNTDQYLGDAAKVSPILDWTRGALGPERIAWLAGRPFDQRHEDLLLVHASPTDVEGTLVTTPDPFDHFSVTEGRVAAGLLGDVAAGLIVYGHIHYASAAEVAGRRVASIGSVGFPFDGDPRAAYAIAERFDDGWRLEHRRVAYDHAAVAARLRSQAAPLAEARAERILQARALPLT